MLLTDAQLHEIRQIIADHHSAFVANAISPKAISPDTLAALKRRGFINLSGETVADAYLYGQVLAALNDPKAAKMSLAEFRRYVARNPVPLSAPEKHAVAMAQQQAAQYVVGLGNRINTQAGALLIDADATLRRQARDTIRTQVAESIDKRQTAKQLRSALGHATEDWGRDLDRVAVTEQHNAMQTGVADSMQREAKGKPVRVAKRNFAGCCPECRELYTGPDGQPRIFELSALEANGTNVGRRRSEWQPVVGSTHPNCCCALVRVPAGFGYTERGTLEPGGKLGVETAAKSAPLPRRHRDLIVKAANPTPTYSVHGVPVVVEYPKGSTRTWSSGASTVMSSDYGYLPGAQGADNEDLDCYVGPDPTATEVHVVHQNSFGNLYDEDKVMLGFASQQDAAQAYAAHFDQQTFARLFGGISSMSVEQFKRWAFPTLNKADDGQPIAAEYAAMGSQMGRRQPRIDAADGSNFVVSTPARAGKNRKQPADRAGLSARKLMQDSAEVVVKPQVDQSDLPVDDPQMPQVNRLIITDTAYDDRDRASQADTTKRAIETYYRQRAIPPNRAVTDVRTPVLQSGARTPVRRGADAS